MKKTISVSSKLIAACRVFRAYFNDCSITVKKYSDADIIGGWGYAATAAEAREYAVKNNISYIGFEDGFIRSVFPSSVLTKDERLSLIWDTTGVYYNSEKPSDLDKLIAAAAERIDRKRALKLMTEITKFEISKYNHGTKFPEQNFSGRKILIIDQTLNDNSIKYGQADKNDFDRMTLDAVKENPYAKIYVKIHPDVLAGKKKGCVDLKLLPEDAVVIDKQYNMLSVLKQIDAVYTVTSQSGFEALLMNKEVFCYGIPFYSGWGVVNERSLKSMPSHRNVKASVEEIFWASYVEYTRYFNPETGQPCDIEDVIDFIKTQNRAFDILGDGKIWVIGISVWKSEIIKDFFKNRSGCAVFSKSFNKALSQGLNHEDTLVFWGIKDEFQAAQAVKSGYKVLRAEDGFIRSSGLGTDMVSPLSLAVDDAGIYYDATRASRIENILNTAAFTNDDLVRTEKLTQALINNNITKYNVGKPSEIKINKRNGAKVILVPGQVPSDASISCGCTGDVRTNIALLKAVRKKCPDDFILYKIHPDIYSGNRKDTVSVAELKNSCDLMVSDVSITDCINMADEVHVMSSLAGFEALIRGKKVVCYGAPFYSGWGSTEDEIDTGRRKKQRSPQEIAAAALLLYPFYLHPVSGCFTKPENILPFMVRSVSKSGTNPLLKVINKLCLTAGIIIRRSAARLFNLR